MENEARLEYAKWILERNLHWISAVEVKVGFIIAVDTAMLGALAAAVSTTKFSENGAWTNLFTIVTVVTLISAFICAAMAVKPDTKGPPTSFVFFGEIAAQTGADYVDQFKRANDESFLQDLLRQIHRNAEIAKNKYDWVKSAVGWSFFSVPIWAAAIVCVLKDR